MSKQKPVQIIADLFFAYMKNDNLTHTFEVKVLEEALYYLQEHYEGSHYDLKGFENFINRTQEKEN